MIYRSSHIGVPLAVLLIGFPLLAFAQEAAPPEKQTPKDQSAKPRVDLYGNPLPEGAIARLGSLKFRQGGDVYSVSFSRDGKFVASAGMWGIARVWEVSTQKQVFQFGGGDKDEYAYCVAFSPDGTTLALGGAVSGGVVFHRVTTGARIGSIGRGSGSRRSQTVGRQGRRMAWMNSASDDDLDADLDSFN
ncbi:MAG: hypothetical protein O7H41_17575 [Planctomycetota bacterium]|nr:hypothetical protein [Planctomycetota bacterium]